MVYIYNVIKMPIIIIITYLVVLHVMLRLDRAMEVRHCDIGMNSVKQNLIITLYNNLCN
jgi:hypothetical protein